MNAKRKSARLILRDDALADLAFEAVDGRPFSSEIAASVASHVLSVEPIA